MPLEGTTDFFLLQGTALRLIYERAEPFLWATQFVRPIQDDKAAFLYRYDNVGMDADPKKKKPAHALIGGDFPEIDMSRPSVGSGMTESRGFSVRIKRQLIREQAQGINEIQRAYKFAGFWMARYINDNVIDAMKTYTGASMTPTAVWSAAGATPVNDMQVLAAEMDREGYAYSMTDMLVHKDNWYEAIRYLTSIDISEGKQRMFYGLPDIKKDNFTVPISGADLWKIKSGLAEGSFLCIDRNNPGIELHYYVDSKFGTDTVQYETVINGAKTSTTAANVGMHFDTWVEKGSEDTMLKFWVESKPVVTEAYAGLYKSTGI